MTDLEAFVDRVEGWWVAGFKLPTFFSTSLDLQVAIDFAAGQAGTAVPTHKPGMIIEFKCNEEIGADVFWISKFFTEKEVLVGPWLIASPDCSRTKHIEKVKTGQNPMNIGKIKGKKGRFSVYKSEKAAK